MSFLNLRRNLHKPYFSSVMNIVSSQIATKLGTLLFYNIRVPGNNEDYHRSQGLRKRVGVSEVFFQR